MLLPQFDLLYLVNETRELGASLYGSKSFADEFRVGKISMTRFYNMINQNGNINKTVIHK